ncbi:ribonuclease H-like domain-containing protein [Tanacetum coccineum]
MSANDNFSLHDDEELSLHDDASLNGSEPVSNKGDAPAKPPQIITTNTLSNIKLPVLQKDDYDTWAMEMEHYLEYIDNEVWKVIQNGNSKKRVTKGKDGVYRVLPPSTQTEQVADEKERKARTLLLMAVPKDHLRRFHGMDDAKEIWAAIKTRFGGNANSKKMQKAVLKQQFEAFTISSKESLEKGYDRFQKLLSQLDALGASVSDEDANHKFLRSLPPAWDSLAMTMRTKKNIDTLSIDDLYNNLRSYSSYTTSSSKATPTATPGLADEVIHSFLATNADDVDLIHEDLDQIDDLDLEEMDINWQIAMTAIKIKKFYKKTGRRPRVDGKMHVAFDKRKVECFNCHNTGHFARECKFKGTKDGSRQEASRGQDFKPVRTEKEALMTIDEGQINWVEQTTDEELNHALMAFTVNNEDHPLKHMEHRGIFDSGCSGHMTGNRAHLEDYQELSKVGSVTFGGSKGSISGKGTIRLGNLVFDDVAFVKELGHFNLFSISQICDKKLNVLFTEKECFVVSSDFKMPDENQVLLKVPRQHNMYTFDMKNVDSSKGYTCLLAKASSNEAKLCLVRQQEAVNTACSTFNRGHAVPLGKFDGKSDEGFLVGYSVNSKAFRVYNLATKRVEVNLHVNFLEEKPNVQGLGHRWMFDLDYLTDSMNYIPVSLQNQANPAGSKEVIDIDVQTEEAEELLVVSSTSRKAAGSEHNATKKSHSSKKPSSTPISKSADDIMVFRKELDALALKHLGPVPTKTPTSTNLVNTGGGNVNTGNKQVSPDHIEAVSPSAHNVEEVFSDDDNDDMPEIRIYDKSSEGIFEQASYDDEGVITDLKFP